MRVAAFLTWFVPLVSLYAALFIGNQAIKKHRKFSAEKQLQAERERAAAIRKEKAEARKLEKEGRAKPIAINASTQPPKKRGRPRKNPITEEAAAVPVATYKKPETMPEVISISLDAFADMMHNAA